MTTVVPIEVANDLALTIPPNGLSRLSRHCVSRADQSLTTTKPPIACRPSAGVQSRTSCAITIPSSSS